MRLTITLILALNFFASALALARPSDSPNVRSHFVQLGKLRVHYLEAGPSQGPHALVLVHGWACSADYWNRSIGAFPDMRVIAVDLPGHGLSDKPHVEYTMDLFARSIEAVLTAAGVRRVVLVGHSMGTLVIRQFYRHYPEQALGLIVVDGTLIGGTGQERQGFLSPFRDNYDAAAKALIDALLTTTADSDLKERIQRDMLATPAYVGLSALEGATDPKVFKRDPINVPVLAILAQSMGWKEDAEQALRAVVSNLQFHIWSEVGHFLMMERPEAFNESVRAFLSRNAMLETSASSSHGG